MTRTGNASCVVISGCSGGGKSTLVAELARRGFPIVDEPGRRVIAAQRAIGGSALPWLDMEAFLIEALQLGLADRMDAAHTQRCTFFDRSLVDAASALTSLGKPVSENVQGWLHAYQRVVFFTPPWAEIYSVDADRRHSLDAAEIEYDRLRVDYPALGYTVEILPKAPVDVRADWLLARLA